MTAPDLSRFDEGSSDEDDFIARVRARELAEGADDASADADASPPTTSGGGGDDKTDADARVWPSDDDTSLGVVSNSTSTCSKSRSDTWTA